MSRRTPPPKRTLMDMRAGERGRIGGFDSTLDPAYQQRLAELGFVPGVAIACARRPVLGAPCLYRIEASVFSLDDTLARCVLLDSIGHAPPTAGAQAATHS
jgi:Fe2+ transport system protein FeoA